MWRVIGQERAVTMLQQSLEKGNMAHAYLFTGPRCVGKTTLALELAKALNCEADEPPCGECGSCRKIDRRQHADVQVIGLNSDNDANEEKQQTEISIERIRRLQHSASLPPFEGRCRVFIIDGAEFLSIEAANCLLKTLEEPEEKVVFVMLTAKRSFIPETVISRCQWLKLAPVSAWEIEKELNERWGVEPQKARLLARLCRGCIGWAISA
ncbi:MAG TPA: AAA family ATPase, partial [Dehalococcoidia bacterium]|nr:AAA family ATPase [Dehalococcoidia bacterium]